MTKVSVIIPIGKNRRYLPNCLDSLKKQEGVALEIISVNDEENLGPGVARNQGAKKAKGKILVFVDADMRFESDFVKKLIEPIEAGGVKGTFSSDEYVANWDNIWARCWNYNRGLGRRNIPDNLGQAPVFRAILKSEFARVGGFDPVGYDDDWTLAKKLGYQAQLAKSAQYYHYNPDNIIEVFYHAKWVAKRNYKLGILGGILKLISLTLPFSLVRALSGSLKWRQPAMLVFCLVYDLAAFYGLVEKLIFGKNY